MNKSDPFGDMPPNESFMTGSEPVHDGQAGVAEEPVQADHVGALLCATRMRLGGDLQEIARILRIRYGYLVAIEDGRYEDLPGAAYSIGFVRAYADFLGLDSNEVVRRLREESAGVVKSARLEFTLPSGDSGLPNGGLLAVAIGLGMIVYAAWYSVSNGDRDAVDLIQEVPGRLAVLLDDGDVNTPSVDQPAQTANQIETEVSDAIAPAPAPSSSEEPAEEQSITEPEITIAAAESESLEPDNDASVVQEDDSSADPPEAADVSSTETSAPAAEPEQASDQQTAEVEQPTPEQSAPQIEEQPQTDPEPIETAADESSSNTEPQSSEPDEPLSSETLEEQVAAAPPPESEVAQSEDQVAERVPDAESADEPVVEPTQTTDTTEPKQEDIVPTAQDEAVQTAQTEADDSASEEAEVTGQEENVTEETVTASVANEDENLTIELRAKSDSWIQVRDGDDLLITRLLRQEEVYRVPDRDGLTLMTGNAGGLEVFVGGELMPPLGDEGVVRRGVPLSAERLRSGSRPG